MNLINGFKGFGEDLKCRGFQYQVGGEFEEADAQACRKGFHFCENPMDVLNYYPPASSRYATVEGSGKTDKDSDDSKVACSKLKIGIEIGINGLISAGVKFMLERIKWEDSKESNTGNRSAATNTGDQSAATVEGKESVAIATGYEGKARGALGCWIVVAEWEERGFEYHIKAVKSVMVDGETIKANTFYKLVNGEFVDCE